MNHRHAVTRIRAVLKKYLELSLEADKAVLDEEEVDQLQLDVDAVARMSLRDLRHAFVDMAGGDNGVFKLMYEAMTGEIYPSGDIVFENDTEPAPATLEEYVEAMRAFAIRRLDAAMKYMELPAEGEEFALAAAARKRLLTGDLRVIEAQLYYLAQNDPRQIAAFYQEIMTGINVSHQSRWEA